MTENELEELRLECGIPDTIELRLLRKEEKPSQPLDGSVLIHPGFFRCGFRLPLHPYVYKLLRNLGLAPMQISPNVYIAWLSMYVLWRQLGLGEPSFAQFANQYCLKKHAGSTRWWYVCAFMNVGGALITNNPSKQTWKNKYFFASGDWEFREGDVGPGVRVQACFCRADRWTRPPLRGQKLEQIVRVRAEKSAIERSDKRLTTPSRLAELASPKNSGGMSPEKRTRNQSSRLAESMRRALEEQRKAEQRKGGSGGKVGRPTIPVDGELGPLQVIPPSTPSSQPTIVLDDVGSTEKDGDVDMMTVDPDPKRRRVGDGGTHQHQTNPSGLRIHSAFTSFFRTCQLGIGDSNLEGFEGKSPSGKIDMALQATLEVTLVSHGQLETRGLLQKQSDEIKELGKKNEDNDLLIAKLRSVVDLEKKKVSDAKSELKGMAEKHTKDVGIIQDQVARLVSEVMELRSAKDKVIEEFKSSEELEGLKSTCWDEGFQSCMKAMKRCYPILDWTILEGALTRGELDLSDDEDDGALSPDMGGPMVGEVETCTSEVGVHDEAVLGGTLGG